ncbi:hypothetical protein SPSIL_047520 [Sporomusa silvacetica DSM 10669]|uniref:Double zinc ribbon n=1 Tax=Sporomusa silvacetica DSM 10669 TaxID=1123289 RepID=A0ABZ3IS47_9FIRM|nr:hypothetical protein [Sporomusa silvacetica]OZC14521.1 hypothetical protein SPSIL_46720 [Sporomusa silvacetica DSM 10669]
MCWVCNPSCGKCKPPIQIVKCPACGAHNLVSIKNCKKCRATLPEQIRQPAIMCHYSGLKCVNPCGRHQDTPKDGMAKLCNRNTPPSSSNNNAADEMVVPKNSMNLRQEK